MTTSDILINSVAHTTEQRDRDELNHAVAQLLLQFLDAESVCVYKIFDEAGVANVECSLAITRDRETSINGGDAFTPLPLADMPTWQRCAAQHEVVHYATLFGCWRSVFPVEREREIVGLLEIETKNVLSPREVILVGGIMRILKNHIALLDYGECDTLTGLLNRKTFESRFDKLRRRLHSANAPANNIEPSWLAIVDIDKFKSINDTYGHLFGDEVLLLVSQLMKQSFRGADLLFRFGGEEFLVVLDHASMAGAAIALERLRETIANYRFPQIAQVTISLGYTQIDSNDAPSSCVERADAALYYAKHHGRNNVRHYEALIASNELTVKQDNAAIAIELF